MLEEVHQSNDNAENDWDAATEEHVLQLLKALNDATEFPVPSKKALQVILKALSTEGPCSFLAWDLLFKAKSWFIDTNSQSTMQEHDVWSQMGVVIMNELWEPRDSGRNYIELGEMLSSLTQWTPYIHRNLSHWITIYSAMAIFSQEKLQAPYLSILERIWGVKYTGTYHFTEAAEKTSAWTLIALSIVWEGFNFSAQQTLQDLYQLIRCTIYIAFRLHKPYEHNPWVRALISPNFRATFSTGLGDALIQAARNADGVVSQTPTQIENQPEDSSPQEETHIFHRAAGILDEMGQVLKHETEGEQVDCGEERAREYWDNLRTHFEVQVHKLEELVKETPETAEISS
ncbi:hypothetical protein C8J57DRAFT_1725246 [Mycena rebaudengoi]|nr:hypothetical protein C8J57DRAFT_1725246 [Mycena rebaudengoi]